MLLEKVSPALLTSRLPALPLCLHRLHERWQGSKRGIFSVACSSETPGKSAWGLPLGFLVHPPRHPPVEVL